MVIEKGGEDAKIDIKIHNTSLDQAQNFCYLGSIINNKNTCDTEIERRIALAKQAFQNKKNLLVNNYVSLKTKKMFIKTFVWSVLLYWCETWKSGEWKETSLKLWKHGFGGN